ncbi:KilA-N domain-containing protein [Salmonella enterica subsp. enterica serovar Paratyphi C str. CFSAN000603]|nr:KilA-N domain-containing protein [Salmonella enterica subsp. enterica serovar Paratyphi C str. CFSAN000603]HAB6612428.1 KilA-N domain-containing protein [Salmonella enterica subsp. enterica serovar Paratyphi C]HAE8319335.1 KilA-N domain-containing protein [Salmonella enterica subsp. enterica serovar Paratyphi C]HAE8363009.1 KilA-N domain-containing protein [Salmonella enterica subsp. enterica serovar Paratyphi B]
MQLEVKQMHKVVQRMPMAIQEINMKEITLTFNNITTKLFSDEEGMFNLNLLHKASGDEKRNRPSYWTANSETQKFIQELETGIPVSKTKRGRGVTGTWGIEQIVYAYASWISPEFHAAVIEAFTHAVNGDGKKAVKKAQWTEFRPLRSLVVKKLLSLNVE